MARTKSAPVVTLTRKETCTTDGCAAPRIRLNALKCTEHEIVYRAAAKARAIARKAASATVATPATKRAARATATPAPANVAPNGLRTTRPPRPARTPIAASPATPTAS
jgi:hypothetical protein